jgi:hypothetical protein
MTAKEKEDKLNIQLSSESSEVLLANYQYLTNGDYFQNKIKPHVLNNWIKKGKLGSLLRKLDKTAFEDLTKDFI